MRCMLGCRLRVEGGPSGARLPACRSRRSTPSRFYPGKQRGGLGLGGLLPEMESQALPERQPRSPSDKSGQDPGDRKGDNPGPDGSADVGQIGDGTSAFDSELLPLERAVEHAADGHQRRDHEGQEHGRQTGSGPAALGAFGRFLGLAVCASGLLVSRRIPQSGGSALCHLGRVAWAPNADALKVASNRGQFAPHEPTHRRSGSGARRH